MVSFYNPRPMNTNYALKDLIYLARRLYFIESQLTAFALFSLIAKYQLLSISCPIFIPLYSTRQSSINVMSMQMTPR